MTTVSLNRTLLLLSVIVVAAFLIAVPMWTYLEGQRIGRMAGFNDCMDAPELRKSYDGGECILETKEYIKRFHARSDGSCWSADAP